MSDIIYGIGLGGIIVLALALVLRFTARRTTDERTLTGFQNTILQQLNALTQEVNLRLKENREALERSNTDLNQRLESATKVVSGVTVRLTELHESSKRIHDIGKDIAGLQEILRAPKLRGGIGEYLLGDLLAQILPREHFALQHRFKSGAIADAVIFLKDLAVPVDAKFPLENFRRFIAASGSDNDRARARREFVSDVKGHIDAIASKYILPDEGTANFALMYIPAENVYYETILRPDNASGVIEYAFLKRVIPVSPNSFYAYLQTIVTGLAAFQIEKSASLMLGSINALKGQFAKFSSSFAVLGTHVSHARTSYNEAEKQLGRLETKLGEVARPEVSGAAPAPEVAGPKTKVS